MTVVRVQVKPSFALPTFREVSGLPGTITVVMTGRQECIRNAVAGVLRDEGLSYDLLVLKPNAGTNAICARAVARHDV